jgi:dinuclear metal center YbgI/SA1388 family protein
MYAKGQTIIQWMEQLAPKHLAVSDDKIGLQIGTLNKEVRNLLVTLDVTEPIVDEAIANHVDLIIAHHALIFRPLQHVNTDSSQGRMIEKLIKHNISLYISHTNLDVAEGGLNDWLASAIGLTNTIPLDEVYQEKIYKLVVFVPISHHVAVRDAMFAAGAGAIGDYSHCSFSQLGTGTYLPLESANPFIGEKGKLELVEEHRIEVIVSEKVKKSVIQAMEKSHPYEEVAYDLFASLVNGPTYGLGRIGNLPEEISLKHFVSQVKEAFNVSVVRVVGQPNKPIRKVAVLGGSGGRYARRAEFLGADAFVTGDIDYHVALDAIASGLTLIDVGHHVEKIMKTKVAAYLSQQITHRKLHTKAMASQIDTEPFQFM